MYNAENTLRAFFQLDSGEQAAILSEFKVNELFHMFVEDIAAYDGVMDAYTSNIETLQAEMDKERSVRDALSRFRKNCDIFELQEKQTGSISLKMEEQESTEVPMGNEAKQSKDIILKGKEKREDKDKIITDKDASTDKNAEKRRNAEKQKQLEENEDFCVQVGAEALGALLGLVFLGALIS